MKKNSADVVYRYRKEHATREQLISALETCSDPGSSCKGCIYKEMKVKGCTAQLMEDAAHYLRESTS